MSGAIQKSEPGQGEHAPHAILRDLATEVIEAPSGSRVSKYALVIGALVLVGGGAIFAMRQVGLRAGMNMDLAALKYDRKQTMTQASFEKIMADLAACDQRPQIPGDYIVVDPFRSESHASGAQPNNDALAEAERARLKAIEEQRKAAEERAREIQNAFDALTLVSILGGTRPVANISGTLARVGDTVGGHFTLAAINGAEATLVCDGMEYVLVLGEEPTAPARKTRKPRSR